MRGPEARMQFLQRSVYSKINQMGLVQSSHSDPMTTLYQHRYKPMLSSDSMLGQWKAPGYKPDANSELLVRISLEIPVIFGALAALAIRRDRHHLRWQEPERCSFHSWADICSSETTYNSGGPSTSRDSLKGSKQVRSLFKNEKPRQMKNIVSQLES